jgi:hypothetical protein
MAQKEHKQEFPAMRISSWVKNLHIEAIDEALLSCFAVSRFYGIERKS